MVEGTGKPPLGSLRSSDFFSRRDLIPTILSSVDFSGAERSLLRRFLRFFFESCFKLTFLSWVYGSGASCSSYNLTIWHISSIVAPGIISLTFSGDPFVIADSVHRSFAEIFRSNTSAILVGQVYARFFDDVTTCDSWLERADLLRDIRCLLGSLCSSRLSELVWGSFIPSSFCSCCAVFELDASVCPSAGLLFLRPPPAIEVSTECSESA